MNRKFKHTLLASLLIAAGALSGCTTFPEDYQKRIESPIDAKSEVNWASGPAISYVDASSAMAVKKFSELPALLAAIPIEFKFSARSTLGDVTAALSTQNLKFVNALEDHTQSIQLPSFKGTLGQLLDELSVSNNIGYEYLHGVIFLKDNNRFTVTLPQNEALFTKVAAVITSFGATNVTPDIQASQIFYTAKPDAALQITEYLQVVAKNSAMVTLQVAVLDVSLSQDRNVGLDWSQMATHLGAQNLDAVAGALVPNLGSVIGFSGGSGVALKVVANKFSLSGVLRALSTIGEAKTEQNVTMGTLSGVKVTISSGNSIPYVKSIGATTTGVSSTAVQGTAVTDVVKSGLKLSLTPNFNAMDMSVTTELKAEMSSLVGFRELSAGANLGNLSQPEIQEMTFENMGRIAAGATLVVGGITYDQASKNYTSLPGLEKSAVGSRSEKVQKHAIYIVVRPSVTLFGKDPATIPAAPPLTVPDAVLAGRLAVSSIAPAAVVAPAVKPKARVNARIATNSPKPVAQNQAVAPVPPPKAALPSPLPARVVAAPGANAAGLLPVPPAYVASHARVAATGVAHLPVMPAAPTVGAPARAATSAGPLPPASLPVAPTTAAPGAQLLKKVTHD